MIKDEAIEQLKNQLIAAKDTENAAKKERRRIENEIISIVKYELYDNKTNNLYGLKIVTGYNRKWNQYMLRDLVENGIPPKLFPFKTAYKEDKKMSDYLANNEPEMWDHISKALTLTPKKASISIIEQENI